MILKLPTVLFSACVLVTTFNPLQAAALSPSDVPADIPVSQILSLASQSLSSGSSSDAITYYDVATTRDPKNYLTFFKRGATYLSLGRLEKAQKDFDRVLEIRPKFEGALLQRAKIKARGADWKGAREDYKAAGKDDQSEEVSGIDEAETAAKDAKAASRKRNWEECVTRASLAIMTAAGALDLRNLRTRCRLEKGEILEAVSDLQQVLQLNPSASEPPVQISAMMFYSMGEMDKGVDAIKKCLHADPDSKRCSRLFKRQKKIEKTMKKVNGLVEKRQYSSAAKLLVRQGEEEPGLIEEIRTDMKEYRQQGVIHPKAPEELLSRLLETTCNAYLEMNNHKRAQPYCTDALAHNPHSLPALLHTAQAQLDAEDPEAAIRTLNTARENSTGAQSSQKLQKMLNEAQTALKRAKTKDYYKVLGLGRDASDKEIRRAYRKLSKEFHPDKVTSPEARPAAEKKMSAINEAYEVLKDPELKAKFDAGEDPNDPMAGQGGPGGHPFQGGGDPFAQFFGGSGGSPFGAGGGGQRQFVFRSGGGGGGQQGFKFPGGGFPFG